VVIRLLKDLTLFIEKDSVKRLTMHAERLTLCNGKRINTWKVKKQSVAEREELGSVVAPSGFEGWIVRVLRK
jgi:hypothetical protein